MDERHQLDRFVIEFSAKEAQDTDGMFAAGRYLVVRLPDTIEQARQLIDQSADHLENASSLSDVLPDLFSSDLEADPADVAADALEAMFTGYVAELALDLLEELAERDCIQPAVSVQHACQQMN